MDSPCRICEFNDEDKNLERHVNCKARIEYAVARGMLSEELLHKEEDPIIKEARDNAKEGKCATPGCRWDAYVKGLCRSCYSKAYRESKKPKAEELDKIVAVIRKKEKVEKNKPKCDEPGCDDDVKARGKCQNHYRVWVRNNLDKVGKYRKDPKRKRTQVNLHYGDTDSEARKIINELEKIAKIELRRTTEQALCFIRKGIEVWKEEHK